MDAINSFPDHLSFAVNDSKTDSIVKAVSFIFVGLLTFSLLLILTIKLYTICHNTEEVSSYSRSEEIENDNIESFNSRIESNSNTEGRTGIWKDGLSNRSSLIEDEETEYSQNSSSMTNQILTAGYMPYHVGSL
mmetsp:Transcript_29081/g.30212  ORF Transcript_29081/g.30212 Transcript_29081/m.30212 type:complete len:134 (+) Transcript_29081:33-434(+)